MKKSKSKIITITTEAKNANKILRVLDGTDIDGSLDFDFQCTIEDAPPATRMVAAPLGLIGVPGDPVTARGRKAAAGR